MNYKHQRDPLIIVPGSVLLLILFAILFSPTGCNPKNQQPPPTDSPTDLPKFDSNRVSWNVLFKPGTDSAARGRIIRSITSNVDSFYLAYNRANGTRLRANFEPVIVCNCDTLLYNLNFLPLDGEGKSVTTAPSGNPPGPAGELVSSNEPISDSSTPVKRSKAEAFKLNNVKIDDSKILAIIDSGLDSALFPPTFSNLLWKDPSSPATTLYNFIPGENKFDKSDNTAVEHGSAVAAITVKAMENAPRYPKIMVLKALNAQGTGSIFSVSCALSYAIQNKATMVNMSLGYYGKPDSILRHYLALGQNPKSPIEIFAAAGNTQGDHKEAILCQDSTNNELGNPLMFYPACFTTDLKNVMSVTQIRQEDEPCIYQNYSNKFVSLGIYDKDDCCMLPVYFYTSTRYYEGSSFATPVATGLRMSSLLQTGVNPWPGLINKDPGAKVTIDGKYIVYSPNP